VKPLTCSLPRRWCLIAATATVLIALPATAGAPGGKPRPPAGTPDRRPREMKPDDLLKQIDEKLNLSPDQEKKIRPILVELAGKVNPIFKSNPRTDDEKRKAMAQIQQLQSGAAEQVAKQLNPTQQKTWKELLAERKIGKGQGGPGKAAPGKGR
jgi:hypothetical protein